MNVIHFAVFIFTVVGCTTPLLFLVIYPLLIDIDEEKPLVIVLMVTTVEAFIVFAAMLLFNSAELFSTTTIDDSDFTAGLLIISSVVQLDKKIDAIDKINKRVIGIGVNP